MTMIAGSPTEGAEGLSNTHMATLFEDLLLGAGADDFRQLENWFGGFCPFEAVGMVRQEIRHGHFLTFLMDPNRPHPFHDYFLKVLLLEAIAKSAADQFPLSPLDIHFLDFSDVLVRREKANIDILVELPPAGPDGEKRGLAVAIELKIDAQESGHQLAKYKQYVATEYPESDWNQAFVFLTLDATPASDENESDWIAVSLADVVKAFDKKLDGLDLSGPATEFYRAYAEMVRRRLMKDEELARLAKRIWAKHKTALETLNEYRPDLQGEVFEILADNPNMLVDAVAQKSGYRLAPDTSSARMLRFSVSEWTEIDGFCESHAEWTLSKSLLMLEMSDWGSGKIGLSFVLFPGEADTRSQIYNSILDRAKAGKIQIGRKTAVLAAQFKRLSSMHVQTRLEYEAAMDREASAAELVQSVIGKAEKFLSRNLPVYDEVLRSLLTGHDRG
ncbi:PD-(D/E)XK nuclease family protein [Pararhodobacter oceanensis]|nr:PD-(D/E)XK nuclease family protein [Pararhodobacter oceanensis]